jgi:hypothetical protein
VRETALESPAVMQLLKDKFISGWSLVADLKICINDTQHYSPDDMKYCKAALDAYAFPVQSMVISNNGTVISTLNANDLLERSNAEAEKFRLTSLTTMLENHVFEDPISVIYRNFLENGITTKN